MQCSQAGILLNFIWYSLMVLFTAVLENDVVKLDLLELNMEQTKYDVFISYSIKDQKVVEGICGFLESRGVKCFVAYRDIPRGKVWASEIVEAIDQSKMMLIAFSEDFNMSAQVDREIELAAENGIPILTFKLSDSKFKGAKKYYLKNLNWIDAFPNPEDFFWDTIR